MSKKIFVIGDLILDEYIEGDNYRISDEAPVPIVKVDGAEPRLGGAANVANNINCLGSEVLLCGAIGNDHAAHKFLTVMNNQGLSTSCIVYCHKMITTIKSRVIIKGQQVVRFDRENMVLPSDAMTHLLNVVYNINPEDINLIVVSDYNKGVVTHEVMGALVDMGVKIVVDPKPSNIDLYRGVYCMTPNLKEFNQITGSNFHKDNLEGIEEVAKGLKEKLKLKCMVVTLGEMGALCCSGYDVVIYPSHKVEVANTIGAGDTFISAFACGLAGDRKTLGESVQLANKAAGIVVSKEYTGVCSKQEIGENN